MGLLKRKHPQRDFFVIDITDVVPKDDTASMEHPIFSLATKPDMRELTYENGDKMLKVIPSGRGLATIHDKDALIWAISKIIHAKNRGEPYSRTVRGSAYDLLAATNRPTSKPGYERLEAAFVRLSGTRFISNIPTGGKIETRIFGLVDEAAFVRDPQKNMRLDAIEITLSKWMFRAVDSLEVVSISPEYFQLRSPMDRRIYEIGRKHCGNQKQWKIGLSKLQEKTGSNAPLKKFRHNIRKIITDDNTPFYRLTLTDDDMVVFRPRTKKEIYRQDITLPEWAEERGRAIAHDKGWDYYVLRNNWLDFAAAESAKGNAPNDAGAAFVAWCKKQQQLR